MKKQVLWRSHTCRDKAAPQRPMKRSSALRCSKVSLPSFATTKERRYVEQHNSEIYRYTTIFLKLARLPTPLMVNNSFGLTPRVLSDVIAAMGPEPARQPEGLMVNLSIQGDSSRVIAYRTADQRKVFAHHGLDLAEFTFIPVETKNLEEFLKELEGKLAFKSIHPSFVDYQHDGTLISRLYTVNEQIGAVDIVVKTLQKAYECRNSGYD